MSPPGVRLRELLPATQRRVAADDAGVLPTVRQAVVGRELGFVLSSDLPGLAARWLAAGLDSPLMRELAGHARHDAWGLDDLWRRMLEELPGAAVDEAVPGEEPAGAEWLPVELARWSRGEITVEQVTSRLLALQQDGHVGAVAGLGELLLVEELRWAPSATREAGDHERDAILTGLAADVLHEG
ncbi:hypothetical protein AB1207_03295 [Kineococcus endophyticus]|uniref:Uncharacterized protein n=1 Tax=Kineococcus endophyticus TaxID=1181883 RepID=A0ABV3P2J8_9ACTN